MVNRPITEQLDLFDFEYPWYAAWYKNSKLPVKLSCLRQTLYLKAKREPKFRFYALYDRIYREDVLGCAYRLVRQNKGAPGVDGIGFKAIEARDGGAEAFVREIHESLRDKTYTPSAVKRTYVPKPDGRKRPLGIPTIRDRVVQMAALLILEPIFEADFLDCSYGFRPNKSAHEALEAIRQGISEGRTAVFDADLKGYFDSIPHDKLVACLRMRVADGSALKLIRMWLGAPVAEKSEDGGTTITRNKKGTPQGGVISPLLANVYLHWFDKVFHFKAGPVNWANAKLVRYADDFVILARYVGTRLGNFVADELEDWLGLELNGTKTKVVDLKVPGASFDFLGYTFRFDRDRHGRDRKYLNVFPSAKSVAARKDKLRETINRNQSFIPATCLIGRVNRQLAGWANYFSFGYVKHAYRKINFFVLQRLYGHLQRKSQRPFKPPEGTTYYRHLQRLGLVVLRPCVPRVPGR